jgi:hypothetical protein
MKYKVGDKVRFITEYPEDYLEWGSYYYPVGAILTITRVTTTNFAYRVTPPSILGGSVVLETDIEPIKRRMFNENN